MRLPDPPRYRDASLSDLVPALLAGLGVGAEANTLDLPEAQRTCLLLIDGLGHDALRRHGETAPFLSSLAGRRITSGFPSTTSVSLTSLGTGLCPGEHGVLGYRTAIPADPGGTLSTLRWDLSVVDPLDWQPHATAFERAVTAGVAVGLATPKAFLGTGLTVAGMRGAEHLPGESTGERIAAAAGWLAHTDAPALAYVYLGDLDATGHRSGCRSLAWLAELGQLDQAAETLAALLPAGTSLYVTSDHGMLDVANDRRIDVDAPEYAHLLDGVRLFTGEPRARYLHVRDGALDDVLWAWREALGIRAWVLSRDEAEAAGWFGDVLAARVRERVGDVVVACAEGLAIVACVREPLEATLVGMHGSLTAIELEVPLLQLLPEDR